MTEDGFAPDVSGTGGAVPPGAVDARVGNVSGGQIAVGNRVIQISAEHGSVVVAGDEEPLVVTPRPTPVLRGLRPPRTIIGRDHELSRIRSLLEQGLSVEVAGPLGVGRTTVLSALSEHILAVSAPQGVVAVPAGLPVDDVLQFVFDACFERSRRVKPTPEELRRYLRDVRILVILDDPELDRQQTERILAALPSAVFAMGVAEPMLLLGDSAITLNGLDRGDAVGLLELALGRPMRPDEYEAAGRLADGLHGMPLQLLQLGAVVRDRGLSLNTVADNIAPSVEDPRAALQAAATESLGTRERSVLVALAAFGGVAVGTGLLAKYASEPDAGTILRRLVGRGLARGDDLTGWSPVDLAVADDDDRMRAGPVLVEWITAEGRQPDEVADQAPVVLGVIHQEQKAGRHDQVIRIATVAEGMLALAGHWGTWRQVLEAGLGAAKTLGDRASAAFFEHQLDIRAGTLQPVTDAQEHLAHGLRDPDTLYRTEPLQTQPLYRGPPTAGVPARVVETGGRGGSRWPLMVGLGLALLALLALVGLLIYLLGQTATNDDGTNGGPGTSPTPTSTDGSGPTPVTPDVSASVDSGELVNGIGTATVRVMDSQGDSEGGRLTIAVENGTISNACGDGGSSIVTCNIESLSPGDEQTINVQFEASTSQVTVTAEFEPSRDDEDLGNNTARLDIIDTGAGPDTGSPDGGPDTVTPNIE